MGPSSQHPAVSIDIIWTNRSILFSSPEKNLVPILGALEICAAYKEAYNCLKPLRLGLQFNRAWWEEHQASGTASTIVAWESGWGEVQSSVAMMVSLRLKQSLNLLRIHPLPHSTINSLFNKEAQFRDTIIAPGVGRMHVAYSQQLHDVSCVLLCRKDIQAWCRMAIVKQWYLHPSDDEFEH
jgi:hypothetical protein